MKRIHLLSHILPLFALSILILSSCKKDDPKLLYQTYGIAYPVENENHKYKIVTDYGNTLIPASNNYVLDTISRVFATFSFVNDADIDNDAAEVNINYLENILFKDITSDSVDLRNSIVYVKENQVWQSAFHNLLNVQFGYTGGSETHVVNLFYNDTLSNADTVLLEFKHNDNDDPNQKRLTALVSFDLNSIDKFVTVSDSIVYKVTFNNGTTTSYIDEWFGVYKPDIKPILHE